MCSTTQYTTPLTCSHLVNRKLQIRNIGWSKKQKQMKFILWLTHLPKEYLGSLILTIIASNKALCFHISHNDHHLFN